MFETEIKEALQKAGLSESLADKIKVRKIEEIEGAVATLKDHEEFLNALKEAGLEDAYKKALQSEADRRVTQALETHKERLAREAVENAEKKAAKKLADELDVKQKAAVQEKDQENLTMEQKEISALKETIKSLQEGFEGFKTNFVAQTTDLSIRSELKKAGMSEEFASYVKVESPDQIAGAVSDLKTKFDTQLQSHINKELEAGRLAAGKVGGIAESVQVMQVAEYAKQKADNAKGTGLAAEQIKQMKH